MSRPLTPEQAARHRSLTRPLAHRRAALTAGDLDVTGLRADLAAQIEELDPEYGAFVKPRQIAAGRPEWPARESVTFKDTVDVAGFATKLGIPAGYAVRPAVSARIARVLAGRGLLALGKVTSTECALGTKKPSRNPRFPHVSPAGSSTGSAVAVAAGFCDVSVGTDSGGSLRWPAVYCGVTALRLTPSPELLEGVHCVAPSMEAPGLITRTADDLAWLWRTHRLAAAFGLADGPAAGPLRIAVTAPRGTDPDLLAALAVAHDRLAALGHDVTRADLPQLWDMIEAAGQLLAKEAHDGFGRLRGRPGLALQPETVRAMTAGAHIGRSQHEDLLARQEAAVRTAGELLTRRYDLIVLPLETGLPDPAERSASTSLPGPSAVDGPGALTLVANFARLPVLSLPMTLSREGSPAGVQVLAARGRDALLVAAGAALNGDGALPDLSAAGEPAGGAIPKVRTQ
ncbi:amidase [Amycolatopsis sp. DG1A-15b]|uniref:amidase family protein n=1 Tax=Amycolatopsis sp. DG1A-15b TaxID=3052846 RepID=UPI00255B734F|nr:amidase [Amycolatopsis sp. DG1A-15b]WIX91443.1 amidase [Amycolatopsis sp. DG1A-15b]